MTALKGGEKGMLIALLETLEGDEEKRLFTRIFNENHIKMERYAIHMLGEQHDAEDAVQNAYIQVIRHFEKIYKIPCEELPFWLISIVKNESLKILRKRNEMVDFEHIDDYVSQTDHELAYHELVALFKALPETYRGVLEMKLILGYSDREIAEHLLSAVFLYVMIGIHDVPGWGGYEVHRHLAGPEEARGGDSKIPRLVT